MLLAKAYLSTQRAASPQNSRLSCAHEISGRTQSLGGPPQEGTPSPYAHLVFGVVSAVRLSSFAAPSLKPFIAVDTGE